MQFTNRSPWKPSMEIGENDLAGARSVRACVGRARVCVFRSERASEEGSRARRKEGKEASLVPFTAASGVPSLCFNCIHSFPSRTSLSLARPGSLVCVCVLCARAVSVCCPCCSSDTAHAAFLACPNLDSNHVNISGRRCHFLSFKLQVCACVFV